MEAADADRQPGGEERPGQIDGAGELVGLHADQPDQRPAARLADLADDPVRPHPAVGLVIGMQADVDVGPSTLRRCASSAKPLRQASVLDGIAERNHWIG